MIRCKSGLIFLEINWRLYSVDSALNMTKYIHYICINYQLFEWSKIKDLPCQAPKNRGRMANKRETAASKPITLWVKSGSWPESRVLYTIGRTVQTYHPQTRMATGSRNDNYSGSGIEELLKDNEQANKVILGIFSRLDKKKTQTQTGTRQMKISGTFRRHLAQS